MTIPEMVCFMVAVTVFGVVSIYAICRLMAQLFREDNVQELKKEHEIALAWAQTLKCDSCAHYADPDCPDYICAECIGKNECICRSCLDASHWELIREFPPEDFA